MQDSQPKSGANALAAVRSGLVEDIMGQTKGNTGHGDADGASNAIEERLRLIINTMPTMVWTLRPDGTVDFVNQRWLDYTGLSLEEEIEDPRTVETHRANIMLKLGLHSLAELIHYAIRHKIFTAPIPAE